MKTAKAWDRRLWAVEMRGSDKTKPMIIGMRWWHESIQPEYPGQPTRCLLFNTRKAAREWCVDATKKHAYHSDGKWKFRPVRIREVVEPIKGTK